MKVLLLQGVTHLKTQFFYFMQCVDGSPPLSGGCFLFFQDSPRVVCCACEEQHQSVLETLQNSRRQLHGFDHSTAVCVKDDVVKPPERRSILILLPYILAQHVPSDVECFFGETVLRKRLMQISSEGLHHVDADAS